MSAVRRRSSFQLHRGFTILELLAAVVLIAIAAIGAAATWSLSTRAAANRRATDMGNYIAVREMERLKSSKYQSLNDTTTGSPSITYFNRYGDPEGSQVTRGFKVKTWISPIVNRDSTTNSEDLREVKIEVRSNDEATLYETARTLLTFGGL